MGGVVPFQCKTNSEKFHDTHLSLENSIVLELPQTDSSIQEKTTLTYESETPVQSNATSEIIEKSVSKNIWESIEVVPLAKETESRNDRLIFNESLVQENPLQDEAFKKTESKSAPLTFNEDTSQNLSLPVDAIIQDAHLPRNNHELNEPHNDFENQNIDSKPFKRQLSSSPNENIIGKPVDTVDLKMLVLSAVFIFLCVFGICSVKYFSRFRTIWIVNRVNPGTNRANPAPI